MTSAETLKYYLGLIKDIDANIDRSRYVYQIYDIDHFEKEFLSDPATLQKVYWQEILQRAHWAAFSSLMRNWQWVKGTISAIEDNNLLSFTVNLRCLLESSGDGLLSLLNVPGTFAENFTEISKCLKGETTDRTLFVSKEIEENLIHFSYARKVTKQERDLVGEIPSYHNAKPASEYIKRLDKNVETGPMSNLYSILCQFAHPAAHSIHYLFQTGFDGEKYLFQYDKDTDNVNIEKILREYSNEITNSLHFGFNPGLLILKTLNFFDYELTKTPYLDKIEFGTMKAWDDIKTKINRRPG